MSSADDSVNTRSVEFFRMYRPGVSPCIPRLVTYPGIFMYALNLRSCLNLMTGVSFTNTEHCPPEPHANYGRLRIARGKCNSNENVKALSTAILFELTRLSTDSMSNLLENTSKGHVCPVQIIDLKETEANHVYVQ